MKKKNKVSVVLEKEAKEPVEEEGLVFRSRVLGMTIRKNGKETFYPNPNLAENKIVKNKKSKRKPACNS